MQQRMRERARAHVCHALHALLHAVTSRVVDRTRARSAPTTIGMLWWSLLRRTWYVLCTLGARMLQTCRCRSDLDNAIKRGSGRPSLQMLDIRLAVYPRTADARSWVGRGCDIATSAHTHAGHKLVAAPDLPTHNLLASSMRSLQRSSPSISQPSLRNAHRVVVRSSELMVPKSRCTACSSFWRSSLWTGPC
jgi:hypothetical protein